MTWTVYEKRPASTGWCKVTYRDHPEIDKKTMRIKAAGSIGPRVRDWPVNEDGKTLAQLQGQS